MKYLITGAGGQLGREWVQFLQHKRLSYSAFGSETLDITNPDLIKKTIDQEKPNVVINCAAFTGVDDAESKKETAFCVNRDGVEYILQACEQTGAKFVHFSTDYVFAGSKEDMEKYPEGYREHAKPDPINTYGASKRAGEVILEKSNYSNWLLIRVSWLCGQYGSNFVKTMLRLTSKTKNINVVDDQFGSPSFAFDVTEKTHNLLSQNQHGIFHVSSRGLINWADLAEAVINITGGDTRVSRIPSSQYPQKANRPHFSYLSTAKIEEQNINPLSWNAGLEMLLTRLNVNRK